MATSAVCSPDFSWAFNSLGQSPCLITALLGAVCNGGVEDVIALPSDPMEEYGGPPVSIACECNTVYYSLLCTCAACQSHNYSSWADWNVNCTSGVSSVYPRTIPGGTAVPHYAFQNISENGTFNVTAAKSDTGPEAKGSAVPTITGGASPTSSSSSTDKSKSHAGAIAGGVVGGLVALTALVLLVWFFRRRRSAAPSHVNLDGKGEPSMDYTTPTPFTVTQTPKLYDPSDPRTFPSPSTSPDTYTTHSGIKQPAHSSNPQFGGYPEL